MSKNYKLIQNVSQSSLILGKLGVLRSLSTRNLTKEEANDIDVLKHIKNGNIKVLKSDADAEVEVKTGSPVDQKMQAVVHNPKSDLLDEKKKKGKTIKKVSSDDLIIENGVEPGVDEDGINFVDIEQVEQRIAQHPVLSKLQNKKGK